MPQNVFPMIAYENAGTAMDWLQRVFGFQERNRITDKEGVVTHGELELSGERLFVATPSKDYQGPKRHAETCDAARRWSSVPWIIDGVLVYVEDVEAHFQKAKTEGASFLSDLETGGAGRQYRVMDLEGHRWMFAQRGPS